MEKLYRIKTLFFLLMMISSIGFAQEKLLILKGTENSQVIQKDTILKAIKGVAIGKLDRLRLTRYDTVLYFNQSGSIFKLNRIGKYSYKALTKKKALTVKSSFLRKYLKYVWNEFTSKDDRMLNKGVVYRGQEGLMLFPNDSLVLHQKYIDFTWEKLPEHNDFYYIIIKSASSDQLIKIGTLDTKMRLFVDGFHLKAGETYQWTVLESDYIDPVNTAWSEFRLLNISEFDLLNTELKQVLAELLALGLKKDDVIKQLQKNYKVPISMLSE